MKRALPLKKRPIDALIVLFFVLNIPVILMIEAQVLLPAWCFPKFLQAVFKWHVRANGDIFMRDLPPYFKGLVLFDILFRLPLLILNCRAFAQGKDWGRLTGLLYGVQGVTGMVPLLAEIYYATTIKRARMLLAYLPFLFVAIYILLRVLPIAHPFSTPYPFKKVVPPTPKPRRAAASS